MPRSRLDLLQWQDDILAKRAAGNTVDVIHHWLIDECGVTLTTRTLYNILRTWGSYNSTHATDDTEELRDRVKTVIYETWLIDKEIVEILELEGFQIKQRQLAKIRADMGLFKRIRGSSEDENRRIEAFMVEEMNRGTMSRYGKGHLWLALRHRGYLAARYDLICIDLFSTN